jgi:hypothetical protein
LGKGTRIGHIDLRDEVIASGRGRPVFEDTAKLQSGDEYRKQSRHAGAQKDDEPLSSTLVAFPGVSISRISRADGSVGWFAGAFGAANEEQLEERIAIRSAETYGVPTATAVLRLSKWCSDEETSVYCSDQFARRILAFAVSDQVLATKDGKYLARLHIQLITRIFLAREIEQSRRIGDQRGAVIQISAEPSREPAKPAQDNSDQPDIARDAPPAVAAGANSRISRSAGHEITLKQVFQRPLVFGYRAVTITLVPSAPGTEALP